MNIFDLPDSLEVNGTIYAIDPDFRNVLRILIAYEDPELAAKEKQYICLYNLYLDFLNMPEKDYAAAYEEAIRFIDNGMEKDEHSGRVMDWEQDAALIFPAVNRVAGREIRAAEFLHWWTFLGLYMEIKDSVYATVLSLRQKREKHEKFNDAEKKFWRANRKLCVLRPKLTAAEKAEEERLNKLFS